MIMQVHDELVFEVDELAASEMSAQVRERMSKAAKLKVPLVVAAGTGRSWDEAH
jgi:DNA polymerase-1